MGYLFDAVNQIHGGDDTLPDPPFNRDDGHPILKFPDERAQSRVESVDQQGGPSGPARPVAACETVRLTERSFDDRVVAMSEPAGLMAEEYRSIRTGLIAKRDQKRHLVHTITSATPQEGKTITSINLGLIFGELYNRKTIVIEADLRLPQFKTLMSLPKSPGLLGVLNGEAQLSEAVQRIDGRNVSFLQAGDRANNDAVQLLASTKATTLFQKLRRQYDHVIVDTPPVADLADAGIIGALSDDVLLIVRMNRTPRTLVEQAIRTLHTFNAPVAGVIATDQKRLRHRYYNYRYGYRYRYNNRYHTQAA